LLLAAGSCMELLRVRRRWHVKWHVAGVDHVSPVTGRPFSDTRSDVRVPSTRAVAAIPYRVPRDQLAIIRQLEQPLGGLDTAECLNRAEPEGNALSQRA
jgi:hypothetical protein